MTTAKVLREITEKAQVRIMKEKSALVQNEYNRIEPILLAQAEQGNRMARLDKEDLNPNLDVRMFITCLKAKGFKVNIGELFFWIVW